MSGPGPGSGGPIYFAWVDKTAATFVEATHCRYDEPVWSVTLTHDEGQIPTAEVELTNPVIDAPYVGLLAASRKQWAWIAVWDYDTETVKPLIFGRIVGIPSDLSSKFIKVLFVARADDYVARKQTIADGLRVFPNYDPIFFDDKSRTDPDAILEGYSAAWHIDRTTLEWSISDILSGEDGTLPIGQDEILSELSFEVKDAPLRAVRATATVSWKQSFRGVVIPVVIGARMTSLTGNAVLSAWPQPGSDLGGGWRAAAGTNAIDIGGTEFIEAYQETGSFQDQNSSHNEGDVISARWSANIPPGSQFDRQESYTYGNIGSGGGVTGQGFGAGIISGNDQSTGGGDSTSAGVQATWRTMVPWTIGVSLFIESDGGANSITENLSFTIFSDVQPVLTDGSSLDATEVIEFSSIDVGEAYAEIRAWSSIKAADGAVTRGQIMQPNIPVGPGGLALQIAINSGTIGSSAPLFSDEPGDTTTDGSVTWASLGGSIPSIGDRSPQTYVRLGAIICIEEIGGYFFLCTSAGYSGSDDPSWNASFGATTGDGGVTWTSLAGGGPSLVVPIGGLPGNIQNPDYFPSARGNSSIEFMISKCAARIRQRCRAVEVGCEIPFALALGLSLRKSATITHKYLPGGQATGKIISYSITANGEGVRSASIKIGCAVGRGGSVTASAGTDDFSDAIAHEAQTQSGVAIALPGVTYVPPLPDPGYSGLKSPISRDDIVLSSGWNYSAILQAAVFGQKMAGASSGSKLGGIGYPATVGQRAGSRGGSQKIPNVSYDVRLRPISGNEVTTAYAVVVSGLVIPKQIDLEAESL